MLESPVRFGSVGSGTVQQPVHASTASDVLTYKRFHYRCYNSEIGRAMTPTKPVRNSDWQDGFLFVANHLVLDFLNTCPVQNGEAIELLSDFDALLRWFRAAGLLRSGHAARLRRQWGE